MKYKLFDVVELKDGNKATIVNIDDSNYKVLVTDKKGINIGTRTVENNDISKMIFSKGFDV